MKVFESQYINASQWLLYLFILAYSHPPMPLSLSRKHTGTAENGFERHRVVFSNNKVSILIQN